MRKLASIRKIDEVRAIEGADAIECAVLGGWTVVIKKNEYKPGDLAVYCEIDSWIPHELAPFLSKGNEPREYNGVKGERLRSINLRSQLSQGLLLPLNVIDGAYRDALEVPLEGLDVTAKLSIQKYEPPVPACLAGEARGLFPGFIPKTDQERCISGETIVQTELGPVKIEDIVQHKMAVKVASFNHETNSIEMKRVVDYSVMSRRDCWIKIRLKSGREIICTNNHMIWCDDILAYRRADNIQIGQKFIVKTE